MANARNSVVSDPASRSAADVDRSTRLRGLGRIIALDVAAPLILFSLLRRHGVSEVTSLIVSGIPPAVAVLADFIRSRKLEVVGALVLSGIVIGVALGLITHSARAVLLEGAVPTFTFALACLVSLRGRRPLMFHFALASSGGEQSKRGQALDTRYAEEPRTAHFFRVVTLVWGIAFLLEVTVKIIVIRTASTDAALAFSRLAAYPLAGLLLVWMFAWGRNSRRAGAAAKDERRD